MKIKKGDKLDIELPTSEGRLFNLKETHGKKVLLTFYRMASCSLCNLRVSQITKRWSEFGSNFQHVSIWHAPQDFLKKNMDRHNIPFIALADENYKYFNKYGVERSIGKTLLALIYRLPNFLLAGLKGFIPFPEITVKGPEYFFRKDLNLCETISIPFRQIQINS